MQHASWPLSVSTAWKEWVTSNLKRGCTPESIGEKMVADGKYSLKDAQSAIAAALFELNNSTVISLPVINTGSRDIDLGDILASVRIELDSPRIVVLDNVLAEDECAELVRLGEGAEKAGVVDSATGKSVFHEGRRARLRGLGEPHPIVAKLEQRLSKLANWPLENFETLQAIGYGPSDEYRPHYDFFKLEDSASSSLLGRGGQRVGTFVTYIQLPEAGGATSFPNVGGLKVVPKVGSTLWFTNLHSSGAPDLNTLHAGDPIVSGTKWVISAWLRANKHRGA